MQEQTMEEMSDCLKSIICQDPNDLTASTSRSSIDTKKEDDRMTVYTLLSLFLNTKILNSYILYASQSSRQKDDTILKSFKQLTRKLKELSYIQQRFIHVDGALSSKETESSQMLSLKRTLAKLQRYKETLEDNVLESFDEFAGLVMQEVDTKIQKDADVLTFVFEYALNMLHGQNVSKQTEKSQKDPKKYWASPYSEISKTWQLSFLVEYEAGSEKDIIQLDLPFVFKLSDQAIVPRKFPQILVEEIRRYALSQLCEQGVERNTIEDIQLRAVNQPELFILSLEGRTDKSAFCKAMENDHFWLDHLFKIELDANITKRYYPRHAIFWNTKYGYYERFTLSTFKMLDEGGKETIQGMWIGEYNKKPQQLAYGDLFYDVVKCHLEPALIIWQKFEHIYIRVEENKISGKQLVDRVDHYENPDKFK